MDYGIFTPQMYLQRYLSQKGKTVEDLGVCSDVIMTTHPMIASALASQIKATLCKEWMYNPYYPLFHGTIGDHPVSIAVVRVGAPGSVLHLEELIAAGAQSFIRVSFVCSLSPDLPVGTLISPDAYYSLEGTSKHYVPDIDVFSAVQPELHAFFTAASLRSGQAVSTDAPYQETPELVEEYQRKGCIAIDMEGAALHAVAGVRKKSMTDLLIISNVLGDGWEASFDGPQLARGYQDAFKLLEQYFKQKG